LILLHRKFILLFCLLLLQLFSYSQTPKREFRAAWIATVANIDWPSARGLPSVEQQQQFVQRLDKLKKLGCNAVIVQVRPCCDACYPSDIEPWSGYLTGKQGEAPFPYYDPLKFMIDEAHARNMEFHAWFNPFRALMDCKRNPNPPSHVTKTHSAWIVNYGDKSYIDPGYPQAREYVLHVIMDVVNRYDIDGIHLDDYFYPYRIGKLQFADGKSYAKYGNGENREDWRRDNVSFFISQLHSSVKNAKPYVKIGISPFGVWRNANRDPAEGSATRAGQTCYDDLYADVLLWMKKGWVDYLIPQLYWSHSNKAASFSVLLPWWNNHAYNRHVYYGLGVYHIAENSDNFGTEELLWQMRDIRKSAANTGFSFYSAVSFDKSEQELVDSIANKYNNLPAFPPVMKWIDSVPPQAPKVSVVKGSTGTLKWTAQGTPTDHVKYVVYRFGKKEAINIDRTDKIISVQQAAEFTDNSKDNKHCKYVVTAMDRLWNESAPSNIINVD
jgi:uncharacterized lipoprotein YddW (UPF0748 family)